MILTIDLSLWTLVLSIITIGYWLGQTRVKEWAVPLNTILALLSIGIAMVWGLMLYGFSVRSIVTYGLPNGVLVWMGSTAAYDFIHEFVKRKAEWLSVWKKVTSLLKPKKEAKA